MKKRKQFPYHYSLRQALIDMVVCSVPPLIFLALLLGLMISTGNCSLMDKSSFGVFKTERKFTTANGDDVRLEYNKNWERHTIANDTCKIIIYERRLV